MKRRAGLLAGLALAAGLGGAGHAFAQGGVAYPAGSYKPWRPWTVLQGQLKTWEMTRGVNTIQVSGGMVVEKTLPPSPQHLYRLKPGQAIALLYQAPKVEGERRTPVWGAFPSQWAKIIRKVDGQTVELKDYQGVLSEWHNTTLMDGVHVQSDMDHRFTGRLNPPLTRDDQWRTHGAWVFQSPEFAPWLNVRTRQGKADVAAVQGKLLTVYFLAHERDEAPWITIEVDFSDYAADAAAGQAKAATAGTTPVEPPTGPEPSAAEKLRRAATERLPRLRP
ncbi:MAG: hypothetical protein JNM26_09425 [Ideonella sp.]|nr:hypothetical protein [Ideonella sp.]